MYISDHPLAPYLETLTQVVTHFSAELGDAEHGQAVTVAGEVSHLRPYQTRTGKAMGFVTLEDLQGSFELVVFAKVWAEVSRWLVPGSIVLVRGKGTDVVSGEMNVFIATGCQTHPEQTPGLKEHEWYKSIFDFYTIEGAMALTRHLRTWQGGRLVVNVVENPIKCPVAPLEFIMLAPGARRSRTSPRWQPR